MSGPTNFAPLIREAVRIVKQTEQVRTLRRRLSSARSARVKACDDVDVYSCFASEELKITAIHVGQR